MNVSNAIALPRGLSMLTTGCSKAARAMRRPARTVCRPFGAVSSVLHQAFARSVTTVAAASIAWASVSAAHAADVRNVTYLLPAPAGEIAFAPFMIAQKKGYYAQQGLSVRFVTVQGGAEVGKQLVAGNGDLGGALGDTPIILRQNGITVKGVALLGGRPLHQLMLRADRQIATPAQLKDKTLTVMSYQDTSFYATLAVLASGGLTRNDVSIQAAGPAGVWQQVAAGKADGMVGTPDWGYNVEDNGVKLIWKSTDAYFPGMAQAILASDKTIASDPAMIKKFVAATLQAYNEIRANPVAATHAFIDAVPSFAGREAYVQKVLTYYVNNIYTAQSTPGAFDAARVQKLEDFYASQKIIHTKTDPKDVFTNQFVE